MAQTQQVQYSKETTTTMMDTTTIIVPPSEPSEEATDRKERPILRKVTDMPTSKLPFPWKLYEMLEDAENNRQDHIVSWVSQGTGFRIHNLDLFIKELIPVYFKHSKFKSFQRQLNFYRFKRVSKGSYIGSYYHPMFVRGFKIKCLSMTPKKSKNVANTLNKPEKSKEDKTLCRVISSDETLIPSEHISSNTQDHNEAEAPRRMTLDATCEVDPKAYERSLQEFGPPSRLPTSSDNNSSARVSFSYCEQNPICHKNSRRKSFLCFQNRSYRDEEPIDGAACNVFGGMIFHFVKGFPQL